jgi:Na+/proline symporter
VTDYYKGLLRHDETVLHIGRLHWVIYARSIVFAAIGAALVPTDPPVDLIGCGLLALAAITAIGPWWRRRTTEIIVTDRRIILKRHWVAVATREINISKIETVDIRQSVIDRLVGSGSLLVVGVGGSWEPFEPVAKPLELRNAIAVG